MGRVNRTLRRLMRAASLGIAFSIFLLISACSHTLNIDSVTGSSERLFVGTRDGSIRVFDLSNHRLVDSIDIPEKIEDRYFHRRISSLLEDHGRVLLQASTTSRTPAEASPIHRLSHRRQKNHKTWDITASEHTGGR